VTGRLERLVALAVTLAPAQATRLLDRLHHDGADEARRQAGALATAPRHVRLGALAAALPPAMREGGEPAGSLPAHPLLRRLELERRGRPVAGRTLVRAAADPGGAPGRNQASSWRHGR
jgi:hypothetical protein